jgi:hypothetical protein
MAAAVDFGADGKPLYFRRWTIPLIVREARACRFRQITLTMFTDGADRAVADNRAALLKAMLIDGHWPQDAIAIDTQPVGLAPSGSDRFDSWTAKALIGFAGPDPAFVPTRNAQSQMCSADPATNAPECWSMQFSSRGTTRILQLPPMGDTSVVYFYADESQLDDNQTKSVADALRVFRIRNYRSILLLGSAGPDETDASGLALRRESAVRDALVHMSMDPGLIVMKQDRVPGTPLDNTAFYRHVTIDFED